MLAGLALDPCSHPEGHKDLLAFFAGRNDNKERQQRTTSRPGWGPLPFWGGGSIWTYRMGEATDGFYLSPKKEDLSSKKRGWSDTRYSSVLEVDPNELLRRHTLVNFETRA